MNRNYNYYKEIFKGKEMPFAFVDMDMFADNAGAIAKNAHGKTIRIASKSLRVAGLLEWLLKSNPVYKGIMCYTFPEAVFLSRKGFDDLLLGYPGWHEQQIKDICAELKKGKTITLMLDSVQHVEHLENIGKAENCIIPVCMDIDMSSDFPGLHFGVWRSSVFGKKDAMKVAEKIRKCSFVKLEGVMGYEAQIAGLGDNAKGKAAMNAIIRFLKKKSVKELTERRREIVQELKKSGFELRFVNGGGTGSMNTTGTETEVTEITVGSGFFSPALFDNYKDFRYQPAAAYAIEIVRQPKPGIFTCLGGGYIASGEIGINKQPVIYLPEGAKLIAQEGTGEVQTPVIYNGKENLQNGSPVFLRHSKAGELCERFNKIYLVSKEKIIGELPTYRGEGYCFL